jgi:hypothetical protein
MATVPNPRHAWRIAVVEVRRGYRKVRGGNAIQLAALGVAVLFGLAVTAGAVVGAYVVGGLLAGGEIDDPVPAATIAAAGVWVMTLLLTAYITAIQTGDIDNRDGMLTTVPHRDVVGGLLLVGFLRTVGIFVVPMLLASVAFAVGAGSVAALVFLLLALLSVLLSAFAVGFATGLAVKYVLGRSETVARNKAALGVLAFVTYMALLLTNSLGKALVPVLDALSVSPVAWYADLALLGVVGTSPLRAGAALVGSGAGVAVGVVASVRVAERLWYADPVVTDERRTESAVADGRLEGYVGRPTAWVARKSWLRARRAPIKLVYVAYPLFLLFQPLQASVEAGQVVATLPATLALYGAWATGAAFTLNPLGDEGAVLPVTLTTPVGGRQFVSGLILAGVAVGLPGTVAVTVAAGALSTLSLPAVVATAAAALVLPVGAAALAAGVGTAFPKFDASQITRSREVVVPSIWGFAVYSLALLLLGSPATAVQVPVLTETAADAVGVTPGVVRAAGLLVSVVLVGVAAFASYRYAVREFEEYTMD